MSDFYHALANSAVGKKVFSAINLPIPTPLERFTLGDTSFIKGAVLVGAAENSTALDTIFANLKLAPAAQAHVLANAIASESIEAAATATQQTAHTYMRSEEHTSELQSRGHLVCRLLLEK